MELVGVQFIEPVFPGRINPPLTLPSEGKGQPRVVEEITTQGKGEGVICHCEATWQSQLATHLSVIAKKRSD